MVSQRDFEMVVQEGLYVQKPIFFLFGTHYPVLTDLVSIHPAKAIPRVVEDLS